MKVLLYGSDGIIRRVGAALFTRGDKAIVVSGGRGKVEDTDRDDIDLAVVDMTAPEATEVCAYLKQTWEVPVVVILGFGEEGWGTLDVVKADGYIHRTAGQNETVARLRAIQRRSVKTTAGKTVKG